ncbi:MAG: hypothetical protein K0R34_2492 [Herbinix sp.]|jgi:hypothetical protein|nr:hypothetical protein [Herbinix sp.]
MKKVVFGGFCMLTGILGLIFISNTNNVLPFLLYLMSLRTSFILFGSLLLIGLFVGIWGVFVDND